MKEKIRKKGFKKRLFSAVLTLALVCSLMSAMSLTARAEFTQIPESNIQWELNGGNLTIKPIDPAKSAVIPDYTEQLGSIPPWHWSKGKLKTVKIESGVTRIGNFAFSSQEELTSVSIPDGIVSIGESAFENNRKLTGITLPESLTTIERCAFKSCSSLNKVKMNSSTPPTAKDNNIFEGCYILTAIYVPYGSVETYKTTANWSKYKEKIVGLDPTPTPDPDPTPTPSPGSDATPSKPSEPAKTDIEIREALEETMPVLPVSVDATEFNKEDAAIIPGTTYNLSNFITTKGIVKGINAAVEASNKAGSNAVTIYSGRPFCFNETILKTIQDGKKNVTYFFKYKGHLYSVTIPATVDATKVLEKAGFAGPFYVGQQLGTIVLVK